MNKRFFAISPILWIFSGIYALIAHIRNWLFDHNLILHGKTYDFPIISVGNITVGGTGKTPHTEYILSILETDFKIATLSRGYKRKTSGFILADDKSTGSTLGDESYQIKRKFPHVAVAVDANRRRGIEKLRNNKELSPLSAIVLDDAFQHRYVTPGLNILLTDCNRLFTDDHMLPLGRLRESVYSMKRANILIVSKCPKDIKPMDFRIISKKLNTFPYQSIYFTSYEYAEIYPLFSKGDTEPDTVSKCSIKDKQLAVLVVTGIVSPEDIYNHIGEYTTHISKLKFSDHHNFSVKDYKQIENKFNDHSGSKIILVTEKDAARMVDDKKMPDSLKPFIYVLPIRVKFLSGQEDKFKQQLITYVRENSRNLRLS